MASRLAVTKGTDRRALRNFSHRDRSPAVPSRSSIPDPPLIEFDAWHGRDDRADIAERPFPNMGVSLACAGGVLHVLQ